MVAQSEVYFDRLVARVDKLEKDHQVCQEQHSECTKKVGHLEGRIDMLQAIMRERKKFGTDRPPLGGNGS